MRFNRLLHSRFMVSVCFPELTFDTTANLVKVSMFIKLTAIIITKN